MLRLLGEESAEASWLIQALEDVLLISRDFLS